MIPPQIIASLLVLVLVMMAIGLMLGIVQKRAIVSVIGSMFLLAFLGPIIGSIVDALPWWASLILTIAFVVSLISWMLPRGTGSHLAALVIHDFLGPITILIMLLSVGLFIWGRL